jgi:Fur family iron response transcriptional regulator
MLLVPEETRKRLIAERAAEFVTSDEVQQRLRQAGLRPTRQRMAIGRLLFGSSHRHVTVDDLFQEAQAADERLSLATIYNTLHHFSEAGLVRRICTGGERVYFDTDTGDHHHFYVEAESRVFDVPEGKATVDHIPAPPPGYEITKVDVVIHIRALEMSATDGEMQGPCNRCQGCDRSGTSECAAASREILAGATK